MAEQSKTHVLALDIETNGSYPLMNEIVSIGYCVGDEEGSIVETGRFDMKVTTPFEPKCYNDFWSKHMDIYEILQKHAVEPATAMRNFVDFVDHWDDLSELRIITDNPAFDVKFIDIAMNRYLNRRPLHYKHDKYYRPIYDTDSYARGVLGLQLDEEWTSDDQVMRELGFSVESIHDHMPEHDAEYIYRMHIATLKAAKKYK